MRLQDRLSLVASIKFSAIIIVNALLLAGLLYGFEYYLWLTDPFRQLPFDTSYYRRYEIFYPEIEAPQIPDDVSGSWSWGHLVRNNKFGFRERSFTNPKSAAVCRIVVLGDSFTKGNGLAEKERFTYLVEQQLNRNFPDKNIEVISLAQSGISTLTQRDYLQNFSALLRPDLIVVGFVLNDPQPKDQNYSIEREQFIEKYGRQLDQALTLLVKAKLPKTAKISQEALYNFLEFAQIIPSWEVALQRVYQPDSAEWQTFLEALQEIKDISDGLNLPPPIFAVLNQDIYLDYPTSYIDQSESLPLHLRWYHQAEQAAAEIGFRTYNHEQEFIEQLSRDEIPVNILDNHPSARVNQIYAQKLSDFITQDLVSQTACLDESANGAEPVIDKPLSARRLLSVKIEDKLRFRGYVSDDPTAIEPGGSLYLRFGWQALSEIKQNYTIMLDLLSSDGQVWLNKEIIPCQGDCLTMFWPSGVIAPPDADIIYWPEDDKIVPHSIENIPYQGEFRDKHTLYFDDDTPPGDYLLILKVYDPQSQQILSAYDEVAQTPLPGGQVVLGKITIP